MSGRSQSNLTAESHLSQKVEMTSMEETRGDLSVDFLGALAFLAPDAISRPKVTPCLSRHGNQGTHDRSSRGEVELNPTVLARQHFVFFGIFVITQSQT
jgi:hypothetical protein